MEKDLILKTAIHDLMEARLLILKTAHQLETHSIHSPDSLLIQKLYQCSVTLHASAAVYAGDCGVKLEEIDPRQGMLPW